MEVSEITESNDQLNEIAPAIVAGVIAGARMALPWLSRQGARMLASRGAATAAAGAATRGATTVGRGAVSAANAAGRLGTGVGIGAAGLAIHDLVGMIDEELMPLIRSAFGSVAAANIIRFASKYGLPVLAGLAILYGGKKIIDYLLKNKELNVRDREARATESTELDELLGIPLTRKGRAVKRASKAAASSLDQEAKQMEIETLVWMKNSGIKKLTPDDFKLYFDQKGLGPVAKPVLDPMPAFTNLSKRQVRQIISQVLKLAYKRTSGFSPSTFAPGKK